MEEVDRQVYAELSADNKQILTGCLRDSAPGFGDRILTSDGGER
jgi:hypothetical protein